MFQGRNLRFWFGLLLFLSSSVAFARPLNVSGLDSMLIAGDWASLYIDSSGFASIQEIQKKSEDQFQNGLATPLTLSSSLGVYWLQMELSSATRKSIVIEIASSFIDEFQLHWQDSLGNWNQIQSGVQVEENRKAFDHWNASVPMLVPSGTPQKVYLRIQLSGNAVAPIRVWDRTAFLAYNHSQMGLIGFFYGILIGAVLLVLLSYLIFKERIAFSYMFLLVAWMLFIASESGVGARFFFPDWFKQLAGFQMPISVQLLAMAFLEFARRSMRLSEESPLWNRMVIMAVMVLGLTIPLGIIWNAVISESVLAIESLVATCLLVVVILQRIRGKADTREVALGLGIPLFIAFAYALDRLLPGTTNTVQVEWLYWSLLTMVVLVGRGLLRKLQWMLQEKVRLHQEIVENLKKADELKDAFLANTSHELRTPLNGIIGIAEALRHDPSGSIPLKAKRNLDHVIRCGRRLSHLINDLLDHAKLKRGEISLEIKALELRPIVGVTLSIIAPIAKRKGIELRNRVPSELPLIKADEDRLQQILLNLLGNAIKFTEEGWVEISAKLSNGMIEICVADSGIGIPVEQHSSIFEMFHQVDTSISRNFGGTGIGLSLTRRLVELHHGSIHVSSQVGKGSEFYVCLPIGSGQTGGISIIHSEFVDEGSEILEDIHGQVNQDAPLVVVVDDEVVNLQIMQNILVPAGYRVKLFSSGAEAIQYFEKGERPELVLLDLMMPIVSGYDVCLQVRQIWNASLLPIVFMTAKSQSKELKKALELGANDFLPKPYEKEELLARIRLHLQVSSINRGYARFVPHEFLEHMQRSDIIQVNLGDQSEQNVAILYVDIRDFTRHSEQLTPAHTFDFLNDYLEVMAPRIRKAGGFVSRFIGDAILALFPGGCEQAFHAARSIHQGLQLLNHQQDDEKKIRIGIAIHSGKAVLGTVGFQSRMDVAIVSEKVQLVMELERMNKVFGTTLIVAEEARSDLTEDVYDRILGFVGRGGSAFYQIWQGEEPPEWWEYREEFESLVQEFWFGDSELVQLQFQSLLERYPEDQAIRAYTNSAQLEAWIGDFVK